MTHILTAWTVSTLLGFRFKQFTQPYSAIVILGALIPDLYKIHYLFELIGLQLGSYFMFIHLPIGSLLIAGIIVQFFERRKFVYFLLVLGIFTHFALDLLLFSGGMSLLYPLSLAKYQIGIISATDPNITTLSIIIALVVYLFYRKVNLQKKL